MGNLKIKKVDDKPMVIHTKEKTKFNVHQATNSLIKGRNILTIDRSPKIKGAIVTDKATGNKGNGRFRKSTIHKRNNKSFNLAQVYKQKRKDSKSSIKVKNGSIKIAGDLGSKLIIDQMEGGKELRESAKFAYMGARPVLRTASKGANLFRKKAMKTNRKNRVKKVESGKKIISRVTKDTTRKITKETSKKVVNEISITATKKGAPVVGTGTGGSAGKKMDQKDIKNGTRNRMITFFLNKLRQEGDNQDSIAKLAKDLIMMRFALALKYMATYIGGFLLLLVLLIAIACLPAIAMVALIYNSPFAIFFPPLEDGDTIISVTSAYVQEFNSEVSAIANGHSGYDEGQIVYVDFEGDSTAPSNYYDIMSVYMVKYGIGDTATIMNDTSKGRLKDVFDEMCDYTTSTGIEIVENEDGTTISVSILYVNVTLKSYREMISIYGFDAYEVELLEEVMSPENLAMIGYTGGSDSGGSRQNTMTNAEIQAILSGVTDAKARLVLSFALAKVGYPYSQDYRDSGNYFDCSSLAYYSWKAAGVDISYGGATTASTEGHGLDEAGKTVTYEEIQPGDLVFISYVSNGRYMNISHVAIYSGNGKIVEAANERIGVVYREIPNVESIVLIGRPQ